MNELEDRMADDNQSTMVSAGLPDLRILGYTGTFTSWGVTFVKQILEDAGYGVTVVPLEQMPPPQAAAVVRLMFGFGPVIDWPASAEPRHRRTLVFLDAPASAMSEMVRRGVDPMEAARDMSRTLAPLASILREDDVLLVDRAKAEDLPAVYAAIVAHLSVALALPPQPMPAGVVTPPEPGVPLEGQALALNRQLIIPLANFVTGLPHDTITWPLICFYDGDHPAEVAAPIVDVLGRARILYFGPYANLPAGRWRADIQVFLCRNAPDTTFGVAVLAGGELVRSKFRPAADGLCELSVQFAIKRAEERVELRIWLLRSAMEGHLGLRQVLLHPVE